MSVGEFVEAQKPAEPRYPSRPGDRRLAKDAFRAELAVWQGAANVLFANENLFDGSAQAESNLEELAGQKPRAVTLEELWAEAGGN